MTEGRRIETGEASVFFGLDDEAEAAGEFAALMERVKKPMKQAAAIPWEADSTEKILHCLEALLNDRVVVDAGFTPADPTRISLARKMVATPAAPARGGARTRLAVMPTAMGPLVGLWDGSTTSNDPTEALGQFNRETLAFSAGRCAPACMPCVSRLARGLGESGPPSVGTQNKSYARRQISVGGEHT